MLHALNGWLERRARSYIAGISLALVIVVFSLDILSGEDLTFSLFYFGPVALAGWYAGRTWGMAIAAAAGAAWFLGTSLDALVDATGWGVLLWNAVVRISFFLIVAYLLTSLRAMLEREKRLARVDSLTGAANSRSFSEFCQAELARGRRYQRPLTLAYLDVDDFKKVNDRLGHGEGDSVLRTIVDTLRSSLRTSDVVARLGGDEFGILLPETDREAAEVVLVRVQRRLAVALERSGSITFSIGAATFANPPDSVDEMIRAADELMYAAKHDGKNALRHEVLRLPRSINLEEEREGATPA